MAGKPLGDARETADVRSELGADGSGASIAAGVAAARDAAGIM